MALATPETLLRNARRYVKDGWAQGSFARDADGKIVNRTDASACRWCVLGALLNAADGLPGGHFVYSDAVSRLQRATQSEIGLTRWNDADTTTQADVLAAFDKAIGNEWRAG